MTKKNILSSVIIFGLLSVSLSIWAIPEWPHFDKEEKQRRVQDYLQQLSEDMDRIRKGGPHFPSTEAIADSAAYYLYNDSEDLPDYLRIYSPIILENYNSMVNGEASNYPALEKAVKTTVKIKKLYDINLLDACLSLSHHYVKDGDYNGGASFLDLAIIVNSNLQNNDFLSINVGQLGTSVYSLAGRKSDALMCSKLVDALLEKYGLQDTPEGKENLIEMIELECYAGNFQSADSLLKKADNSIDPTNELYPDLLLAASIVYNDFNYNQSFTWLDKAIDYAENNPGHSDVIKSYLPLLSHLASDDTAPSRILAVAKRDLIPDDLNSNAFLASVLWKARKYDEANSVIKKTEKIADNLFNQDKDITSTVMSLSSLYSFTEGYKKSSDLIESRLPAMESELVSFPDILFDIYSLWASDLAMAGNYRKSLEVSDRLLRNPELSEKQRLEALQHKGGTYVYMGNTVENLSIIEEILNCYKSHLSQEELANLYIDKAGALIAIYDKRHSKNDSEAQHLIARIRETVENFPPTDGLKLETQLSELFVKSNLKMLEGDKEGMLEYANQADFLLKSIPNREAASSYSTMLALNYLNAGMNDKVIQLIGENVDIPTPDDFQGLIMSYDEMIRAEAYLAKGDKKKAQKSFSALCNKEIELIRKNFRKMTSNERSHYWQSHNRTISNAGRFCRTGETSQYTAMVYDLLLLGKGLMMEADNAFERAVIRSGNKEAIERLDLYHQIHASLNSNKASTLERKDAAIKMDSIELEIMNLVPEAYEIAANTGNVSWKDIKRKLSDKDTAIEFMELEGPDLVRQYAAVVITKNCKNPIYVFIGNETSLLENMNDKYAAAPVWEALMKYMNPNGKTYISAAGVLNNLPIESLLHNGEPLSFTFPIYRLSSTKQLLNERHTNMGKALVIGNIDYDALPEVSVNTELKKDNNINLNSKRQGIKREAGGGVAPLPATEEEVNTIREIFDNKGVEVKLLTQSDASESAFREIPAEKIGLLHIATHGYYLPSGSDNDDIPSLMQLVSSSVRNADEGLWNSGLLLAGANNERETADNDDSILTAMEISQMDFSNTALVTLSACESGLGDLGVFDVYGLQRGFKMSGAGSLLISLRPVYDKETSELMIDFYSNLTQGMEKREALETAKRNLRASNPDPAVWASFILLDALD